MNWEGLVTQLPIVAVFVWFVLEMDRRNAQYAAHRDAAWRDFLQRQGQASDAALQRIADMLDRVSQRLDAHDIAMRQAVARMDGVIKRSRNGDVNQKT